MIPWILQLTTWLFLAASFWVTWRARKYRLQMRAELELWRTIGAVEITYRIDGDTVFSTDVEKLYYILKYSATEPGEKLDIMHNAYIAGAYLNLEFRRPVEEVAQA